jgi:hypothetical protein
VPQYIAGVKDGIRFTRFANIRSAPAADRELAQVSTTFQPDGAQVFV